jgi:hypothetical protein
MVNEGIGVEGTTVVVRGPFTPSMFSPEWFRDQELIGSTERNEQRIEVISRDLAVFRMGWLHCQVTTDSLQLSTPQAEEFDRLRDAVIGTLRLIVHTPVSALGINHDSHTSVGSTKALDVIGHTLAPPDIWSGALSQAATRNLTMWGTRTDGYEGRVQVAVEPSQVIATSVYVNYNDHFSLTVTEGPPEARPLEWGVSEDSGKETTEKTRLALKILLEEWDHSAERAEAARKTVISLADDIA